MHTFTQALPQPNMMQGLELALGYCIVEAPDVPQCRNDDLMMTRCCVITTYVYMSVMQ